MIAFVQAHAGVIEFLRRDSVRRHVESFLRPNRRQLGVIGALIVVTSFVPLALPLVYRQVFDSLITSPDEVSGVLRWAAVIAALGLVNGLASYTLSKRAVELGVRFITHLQVKLYARFQRMPLGFFARAQTGAILARLTHEPVTAESLFSGNLVDVSRSVVTLAGATIVLAVVDIRTIPLVLLIAPSLWLVRRLTTSALGWAMKSITIFSEINVVVEQRLNVAGATVVKLYGDAEAEVGRFEALVERLGDTMVGFRSNIRAVDAFVTAFSTAAIAVGVALGGYLVTRGDLSLGTLVLVLFYVGIIQQPISLLATARLDLARALAGLERIFEILEFPMMDQPPPVPSRTAGEDASSPSGDDGFAGAVGGLTFVEVSYRHPDPSKVMIPSLGRSYEPGDLGDFEVRDVNFTVAPGQMVALVGPTGAGKSTIAALAAGLYHPGRGTVWVDGELMDAASHPRLRGKIALVTQDVYLFHDTIKANLAYGLEGVDHDEIVGACKAAQIHDRIYALPAGYNTVVGERGARLSGGERQRIALARAILRRPSIVILDEATAHLDSVTEAAAHKALVEVFAGSARLVIAHRLSTVASADLILVVEAGHVVEQGTQAALLSTGGAYSRLHAVGLGR